jgi:hypothetical protein
MAMIHASADRSGRPAAWLTGIHRSADGSPDVPSRDGREVRLAAAAALLSN